MQSRIKFRSAFIASGELGARTVPENWTLESLVRTDCVVGV